MADNLAFCITVAGRDAGFSCRDGQDVLSAMVGAGCADLAVGCRGGGCGVCRVQVTAGVYRTRKMSRAQVSAADERAGICLACKLFPQSDLEVRALGPRAPAGRARPVAD